MSGSSSGTSPIPLWPAVGPVDPKDQPTLKPYLLPDGQDHPMVLVLPGGGYGMLADHEGRPIALAFNQQGFHAAVLHYRLGPRHQHPAMINDAQRAIRLIRANAKAWRVDRGRTAILGFSAGGHLASSASVHYDRFTSPQDDLAGSFSARPDASVLCYPVIDLEGQFAHHGSMNNLLGPTPDPAMIRQMSTHLQIDGNTPPAFLWHTMDDPAVPVENSLLYAAACRQHQVRCEVHLYETGQHGLGLAANAHRIGSWVELAGAFLHRHLEY